MGSQMAVAAVGAARSRARRTAPALVALALVLALGPRVAGAAGFSESASAAASVGEDAFDLIVLRPTGAVALALGSIFFAASVPFVAPAPAFKGSTEGIQGAFDVFVHPPYEYTFLRDLGDF